MRLQVQPGLDSKGPMDQVNEFFSVSRWKWETLSVF